MTCIICPSDPFSYPHRPSSTGKRSDGVPLKPMRRVNNMSPPISWPHAWILTTYEGCDGGGGVGGSGSGGVVVMLVVMLLLVAVIDVRKRMVLVMMMII